MIIWRISEHANLTGRGGEIASGRWNHLGAPIVYCTDHPATAMLEILVNLEPEDLPDSYQLLEIEVPDKIKPASPGLPNDWRTDQKVTRALFDKFCADAKSPVMTVPSVIMPHAVNHLINPRHPDAAAITLQSTTKHPLDPRFLT